MVSVNMSVKLVGVMLVSDTYPSVASSITRAMRRMCRACDACDFLRSSVAVSMV